MFSSITGAVSYLAKGGPVMIPLLMLAVVSVAVMIERAIAIRKAAHDNEELMQQIQVQLNQGKINEALALCDQDSSPVASLIATGIRNRHLDNDSIERAMEELALREQPILYKRLGTLDTIITLAPLLGLLGTITGMIKSFAIMGESASGMNSPTLITGGVAEALIATATGLTIAICTLPVYNILTERVKEIIGEMEVRATQLLNILASSRSTEDRKHETKTARA